MGGGERASAASSAQRAWWLRAALVLQAPLAVFTALRDDSDEAANARQEPVTALVLLAGIGGVLAGPTTGRLLDDPEIDGLLVAVLVFLAGGLYGLFGYWVGGGALHAGTLGAGAAGSYRRARHVLAFAAAPLALSLLVWPLRLAIYGSDLFRRGGSDAGAGGRVFDFVELGFVVWAAGLLVVGVHTVYRLSWLRALAALAVAVLVLVVLTAFFYVLA